MSADPAKRPSVVPFPSEVAPPLDIRVLDDATLEFAAESSPVPLEAVPKVRRLTFVVATAAVLLLALVILWPKPVGNRPPALATGSVRIESAPSGAQVIIDGKARGVTPLSVSLSAGSHALQVHDGSRVQDLPITVNANETSAYHIAWAESGPVEEVGSTGRLSVTSDVPGSNVLVDGADRGRTPVTVSGLKAGQHEVVIRSGSTSSRRSVQIEAGSTSSLVVTSRPAQPAWGWVSLHTPFSMQVLEDGKVVGTSEVDRILLSPGNHTLELVSEPFGFRQAHQVTVASGQAAPLPVSIPQVALNINALPWAEVFIDGMAIGQTPLANVMQPIGNHEIVFRHPRLGEKRVTARVTTQGTPRIAVDMRAP